MKKTKKATGNGRIARLFLYLLLPAMLTFEACKDGDTPMGGGMKEFKMSCVTLSRAQVQAWVDSGWTKDSQTAIRALLLQPYSNNANEITGNLSLVAYPGVTYDNVKVGGKSVLTVDTTCKALSVSGPVIFSDNTLNLASLKIFNPDGSLAKFDYIRFTPTRFSKDNDYISYKVEVVVDGQVSEGTGGTYPCPPYCCPPYCL